MSVVMGLDQHRAQITGEWIDIDTGEVSRGRIAPADRQGVRRFLARFDGRELEVVLEATTGWRFVVEELRRVGAIVHLAEPAQTSALRGNKKHAKNDRGDARHLRELLMARRLPECWIPPDHLLDLRAWVRLRHALVHERGEWQQRIHSVLYHRGLPKRASLLTRENRTWVEKLELPATGRESVTDDPEGGQVLSQAIAEYEAMPDEVAERVHLVALPMDDVQENAAIVNALQRRADVVVQESLAEGFGLTVAEAMWKARPVVASRIGGIQDQIVDGETGMLLDDPLDLGAYGAAVCSLLNDPAQAEAIGREAKESVRHRFLGTRTLVQAIELYERYIRGQAQVAAGV